MLLEGNAPFVFDFLGGLEIPFDTFVLMTFIAIGLFVFFFIMAIIFSAVFGSKKKAYKRAVKRNKKLEKTILEKGGTVPAKKSTAQVAEQA